MRQILVAASAIDMVRSDVTPVHNMFLISQNYPSNKISTSKMI